MFVDGAGIEGEGSVAAGSRCEIRKKKTSSTWKSQAYDLLRKPAYHCSEFLWNLPNLPMTDETLFELGNPAPA